MSNFGRPKHKRPRHREEWRWRLRVAIDATNLKHSFIAEEAGIAPATLSRILCGHMNPAFEIVARIAHAAGVTVASLIGEKPVEFTEEEIVILRKAREIIRARFPGDDSDSA